MENGMLVLFRVGETPVTAYSAAIVAVIALGILLLHMQCCKKGLKSLTGLNFALLALPLGLLGARVFYVLCRISLYSEMGNGAALKIWQGGYALWGAVGGAVLAAYLCAKMTGQKMLRLSDAAAAPAAFTIALCRMAEYFNGEGIGMMVEKEAFCFFPLAVSNEWGEWYWAIFMLEAAAALAIFVVLLKGKKAEGWQTKTFFFLFCTCSLLLESLRRDQFLRWLFVRVNQLTAVLVLTGMMVFALVKWLKKKEGRTPKGKTVALCWAGFALLSGACIGLEFAVDKSAYLPVWACYSLMAVCVAGMGLCAGKLLYVKE